MVGILKAMQLSATPGNLGLIVRKNFTDLRDSTIKDFTRYTGIRVPTSKDVKLPGGSEIMFRHMDELAGIVQNVNLGWFLIEQAEEFDSDQEFQKLRGRLRRQGCLHQGMAIANTNGHNWVWRLWKNESSDGFELHEANSFDAIGYLPEDTIEDWRRMEQDSPAHYRRFILNSWEDVDASDKVIPYEWLMRAVGRELMHFKTPSRVVACDPAEFGDDHTVIYGFNGPEIVETEITVKKEPMDTAGRIFRMMREIGGQIAVVDADGIGSGICSRLSELGVRVLRVKSGEKAENEEDFRNMKAQIWMNAQAMFRDDLVCLPDDQRLIEDLAAHSYTFNSKGQVQIEKKKDVKKKLGRSPDQGDAFVLGLWGLTKVDGEEVDEYDDRQATCIADSYVVKSVI
jgi:hypothetical protein